jgi:hypothetical protein
MEISFNLDQGYQSDHIPCVWCTVASLCTTCFNIKELCFTPTEFRMILKINSDYFPTQR